MRTILSTALVSALLLSGCNIPSQGTGNTPFSDCLKISEEDGAINCFRNAPYESCESITDGVEQLGCIASIFGARMQLINTPDECRKMGQIQVSNDPFDLEDGCYRELAERNSDASICSRIKTDEQKNCYKSVGMKTKSPTPCERIPHGWDRDMCYRNVALSSENISYCDLIAEDRLIGECYFNLMHTVKDPSLCDRIKDVQSKGVCQARAAEFSLDTKICDSLQMPEQLLLQTKADCYISIARGKKDPSFCEKVTEDEIWPHALHDRCYSQIAVFMKDETICKNIIDAFMQEDCKNFVEQDKENVR